MDRPSTHEAHNELVNQAMIDAEELRCSIEYDEDYMGDAMSIAEGIAETLENNLKTLYATLLIGLTGRDWKLNNIDRYQTALTGK